MILLRRLNGQHAPHGGVAKPAELGAGDLERAGAGRLEPHVDRHSRNRVLLEAELREEEAVDDVLGAEVDPHRNPHRHVHVVGRDDVVGSVERSVRPSVPDLPVELGGGDHHLLVGLGNLPLDPIPSRAARDRQEDQDDSRHDRPDHLDPRVSVRVGGAHALTLPVAEGEEKQQRLGRDEGDSGDDQDEIEEAIDVRAVGRNTFR